MRKVEMVYRGHHTAGGFILDVPAIGEREARIRVLEVLESTDRLLLLPDGRWLLLCENSTEVDTAVAPGTALVRVGERLVAAPITTGSADVVEYRFGTLAAFETSGLPDVDRSGWFDFGAVIELQPLGPTHVPVPAPLTVNAPEPPDLRAKAGIRERPAATNKLLSELTANARAIAGSSGVRSSTRRRLVRRNSEGSGTPAPSRLRTAIAKRILKSRAGSIVNRKHTKYIEELTHQFRSNDLNEALHRAIPLGGAHEGALSLKLPQRRSALQITARGGAATSVPYGASIHQHLHTIYRQAAKDLEAAGRIDQAAYVLAELLDDATGCVAMLVRNERFDTAARIAEQRELDPAAIVRLWWLAKDRKRAIAIARRHGVFAAVLARLDRDDSRAADELRIEWVADLERAGDLLGAVEAAWPKPALHPLLVNIIRRGESRGGPTGGAICAYGLALRATDESVLSALDVIRRSDDPTGEQFGFLSTFAKIPAVAPEVDRRLATAFIRTNPLELSGDGLKSSWWWKIRGRADTALVVDLPAGKVTQPVPAALLLPPLAPGQLAINDAAAFPNGEVLVALGAIGCRLLRRNGTVAGEWHTPTSHIVMADHGGSALLLDQRPNGEVDIRHLDLTTRRWRSYGTMELNSFANSFDGAQWLVVDNTNAAIVDLSEPSPTVTWRPLEAGAVCLSLLRTKEEVTALVRVSADATGQNMEVRCWDPAMARLGTRRVVQLPSDVSPYLIPNGLLTHRGANVEINLPGAISSVAMATDENAWPVGNLLIRVTPTSKALELVIERLPSRTEILRQEFAQTESSLAFRSHGSLVTVWDPAGFVYVVDLDRLVTVSSIRVML